MKTTSAPLVILAALAIASCGSNDQKEPERLPRTGQMPSGNSMATKQMRYASTTADVLRELDVKPYPGAEIVTQEQASGENLAPDESRYRITLKSKDPLSKVQAYYESALNTKARTEGKVANIFARSERGSDYKITMEPEGEGTKIVETIILYKH